MGMIGKRRCKICGKEYEYCRTQALKEQFRWQDIACCIEHASMYFAQIEAARNPDSADNQNGSQEETK